MASAADDLHSFDLLICQQFDHAEHRSVSEREGIQNYLNHGGRINRHALSAFIKLRGDRFKHARRVEESCIVGKDQPWKTIKRRDLIEKNIVINIGAVSLPFLSARLQNP